MGLRHPVMRVLCKSKLFQGFTGVFTHKTSRGKPDGSRGDHEAFETRSCFQVNVRWIDSPKHDPFSPVYRQMYLTLLSFECATSVYRVGQDFVYSDLI